MKQPGSAGTHPELSTIRSPAASFTRVIVVTLSVSTFPAHKFRKKRSVRRLGLGIYS